MALSKVVRKGSYQGVTQWGISTSSEITPSRKTAQKWAELENARAQTKKNELRHFDGKNDNRTDRHLTAKGE